MTWNNLEIDYVQTSATPGADLYNCAKDAAIIALGEERIVRFVHNDKTYTACPRTLKSIVIATGDNNEETE